MIAGPLVLLPYKRFNDVLDGATFGVASGVAFVGAQTLVSAAALFQSGLQPAGDPVPWVVRLLVLGVGTPIIAAGAIGGLGGALWLRYRAPVKHRDRLGPVGQPLVAFVIAAALLIVSALTEALLPDHLVGEIIALVIIAVLAAASLLWLRRVIHVGLLQEADEIPIGPAILCPECGKETPRHTYCGNCGASLKALPRNRQHLTLASGEGTTDLRAPHETTPAAPDLTGAPTGVATAIATDAAIASAGAPRKRGWLDQRAILGLFAVLLLGAVLIAAVVAFAQGQQRDLPPCPDPEIPCAGLASARSRSRRRRTRPARRSAPLRRLAAPRGHGHRVLGRVRPGAVDGRQPERRDARAPGTQRQRRAPLRRRPGEPVDARGIAEGGA